MKKILYAITSPSHKRVFESFDENSNLEQMIVGPAPSVSKIVPDDYTGFKINNIQYYSDKSELSNIIKKYQPDVYVQADLSPIHKEIKLPSHCKKVYVSHGLIGNHVISLSKSEKFNTFVW